MSGLAWGRLLRLSLAPSAAADVLAGLVIGGQGEFPRELDAAWLVAGSLCVYHGGMVLNDWVDRDADAQLGRDRPLPRGEISAAAAGTAALVLFAAALALCALVSWRALSWMSGVVALVVTYDVLGRGAWVGPVLLGACRAANLGLGLFYVATLAPDPLRVAPPNAALLLSLYGAYTACASRIARLEDVEDERAIGSTPRWALLACATLLVSVAFVAGPRSGFAAPDAAALALALLGALGLFREALRRGAWSRADCGRATGAALRRLLVFTACAVLAARTHSLDGWLVAGAILAGFALSAGLRRLFPPT